MLRFLHYVLCSLMLFLNFSCSNYLQLDRTHFVKDGESVPTVDLSYYQSVQKRPNQDSSLAVAVAISGGGSRASNFAIGIMMGLEEIRVREEEDVLDQIDYLSTVSGGGFAGGAYISSLYEHRFFNRTTPYSLKEYVDRQIQKDLSISYAGFLVRGFFNPRVWFSVLDYGDLLEQNIDNHVLGYNRMKGEGESRSILLGDLFVPKTAVDQEVLYPMHFTNSSTMSTMAIFPFSPDILDRYGVEGYTHRMKTIPKGKGPYDIPLSVGIKASGSFPVLVPNSTLKSNYSEDRPFLHIMDGAMTDNQGYYTAVQILAQDPSSKKVLLLIDADASGNIYTFSEKQGNIGAFTSFFSLAASGLYARRSTIRRDLETIGERLGIKPIFMGFFTIIEGVPLPENIPQKINLKDERKRLIEVLKIQGEGTNLSNLDRHILYELLINIGTKYTIKPDEQELLFLAGRLITRIVKEDLVKTMKNN